MHSLRPRRRRFETNEREYENRKIEMAFRVLHYVKFSV